MVEDQLDKEYDIEIVFIPGIGYCRRGFKCDVIKTNFGEITVRYVNDLAWKADINTLGPESKYGFNAITVLNTVLNKGYHCFISIVVNYKKEFLDKCVLLGVRPVIKIVCNLGRLSYAFVEDYGIYYKYYSV